MRSLYRGCHNDLRTGRYVLSRRMHGCWATKRLEQLLNIRTQLTYFQFVYKITRPDGRCDMRRITNYTLSQNEAFLLVKRIRRCVYRMGW